MRWELSFCADKAVLPMADRHYNRQKPGTPRFVPPGRCFVLKLDGAYWASSWPYAEYVKHAWAGAWMCTAFRRESGPVPSGLIVEAVAATRWYWGEPPALGMVTFVDPSIVPGFFKRTPKGPELSWGYSYQKAGFEYCGWTQGGLYALRLPPERMPEPTQPSGSQVRLFDCA